MKIVSIADKEGSAIDRLCKMNLRRLPHLSIAHICVHPKRPEPAEIELARRLIRSADIVDFQYHKTAVMLRKQIPEIEKKVKLLTHHNEHNIEGEQDWKQYQWDKIFCKNGWQFRKLKDAGFDPILIKHACDFDVLRFTPKLTEEKVVLYVGQIKKVKGVRELAQACQELGYRLHIVGKASEAEYFQELMAKYRSVISLGSDVPDLDMAEVYARARVYCANSDDGTESGTMPILEAMASGIPVVSRKIGLVRDCGENMKNMVIREGKYTDIEDLKQALTTAMESPGLAEELRENAWRTVRQYHPEIQAREYNKWYHKSLYPDQPMVSVLIPTYGRAGVLAENLAALAEQTYLNFEVVVADDGSTDNTEAVVQEARALYGYPIRYLQTGNYPVGEEKKYGLAQARNLAAVESIGEIVVIADDRLRIHPSALAAFVKKLRSFESKKVWVWGSKGTFKSFVENFSATWRRTLIDGGLFCERIEQYGGLTQETSARFAKQGVQFEWCPEASAEPIMGTHSKSRHREDIIKSKITLYKMGFQ